MKLLNKRQGVEVELTMRECASNLTVTRQEGGRRSILQTTIEKDDTAIQNYVTDIVMQIPATHKLYLLLQPCDAFTGLQTVGWLKHCS